MKTLRRLDVNPLDAAGVRRVRRALPRCSFGGSEGADPPPLDLRPADWVRPAPVVGQPQDFWEASDIALLATATSVRVRDPGVGDLPALAGLPELRELSFEGTELVADDLAEVAKLGRLQALDLSGQARVMTPAALAHVARLSSLTTLRLASGEDVLKNASLAPVGKLARLRVLDLSDNGSITDQGVEQLANLRALEVLSFRGCYRIGDRALAQVASLSSLTTLDLSVTRVSDSGIATLSSRTPIRELILQGTSVTDEAVPALAKLVGLRVLDLKQCLRVSDQGVAAIRSALPACRVIPPRGD
jgi:hypothetical protein